MLTIYDENGGYGHPDHIQVHRVGRRAAELAGTPKRYMATMNRDFLVELIRTRIEAGDFDTGDAETPEIDEENFGQPASVITHQIDVTDQITAKRASMRAHASQIGDDHFFSGPARRRLRHQLRPGVVHRRHRSGHRGRAVRHRPVLLGPPNLGP